MQRILGIVFALLLLAGTAEAQLPRPGQKLPAAQVSISGYVCTDLQCALSSGEVPRQTESADCTLEIGIPGQLCIDGTEIWRCDATTAQSCPTDVAWLQIGGGGAGSGDITAVGPFSSGAAFVDGTASTGTTMFWWEGTTVDTNEFMLAAPSANPGADATITFPSATSTILASVTAVAPVTGVPSGTTFLRGDGTWSTPAGSGDVTAVGDCTTGDCFTAAGTGTLLRSLTDFSIELDDDANGTNTFTVKDGLNATVFTVAESGVTTLTGNLLFNSIASPAMSSAAAAAFDNDAWAASRGALQIHDGTASTYVVAALASDTPSNGQVPTWNTGGTITWETASGSGDITDVGPFTSGAAFVNGTASSGTTMFTWEGTSVDANDLTVLSPTANPAATIAITLPNATSTLLSSVTAVAPVTGTPSSSNFLRGDGTWAAPAGSGDVTAVGDCLSGDCFTSAGTGTLLRSLTDFSIELDDNNDGGNTFTVKDGLDATKFTVAESGVVTLTGNLLFNSTASPSMATAAAAVFDNDAWAASRGTIAVFDGTAITNVVAALASDTPTDGQNPTWHTGGTITWDTISGGAAFSALTGGTNTAAAMLVGSGASLGPTGTGTVTGTSLEAGETGTLNNVNYDTTTTDTWWTDLDADGALDAGEQIQYPNRKIIISKTTTGAGLQADIVSCGTTVPCEIHLLPTTYTDICNVIASRNQGIKLIGVPGQTIFKPYTDLDLCTNAAGGGPTGKGNFSMFEINGSNNVEITGITFDGDKHLDTADTCVESTAGAGYHDTCGMAIHINSVGNGLSQNFWIHDNTFTELVNAAIFVTHGAYGTIERNVMSEMGCKQDADGGGMEAFDTPCGDVAGGAALTSWNAVTPIATLASLKTKGWGVAISGVGKYSHNITVRDNRIDRGTYFAIEVAGAGGTDCGAGAAVDTDNCPSNIDVINNEATASASGIGVNGTAYVRIINNRSFLNGVSYLAPEFGGSNGSGFTTGAGSNAHLLIQGNLFYNNEGSGMVIGPSKSDGMNIIDNMITGNCTDHSGSVVGAALDLGGTFLLARGLHVIDNTITGNSGCTYALGTFNNATHSYTGNIEIRGGTYTAGTTGTILIRTPNTLVEGLNVTGNMAIGALATNLIVRNNDVSGTLIADSAATGVLNNNTVGSTYTQGGMNKETIGVGTYATTANVAIGGTTTLASPPTIATDTITTGEVFVGSAPGVGAYTPNVAIAGTFSATSLTVSPSATPTVEFNDTVASDSNAEAKVVGDAVADDNGSLSLQVEDNADGTYKQGLRVFSTAGVTVARVGNDTNSLDVSEAGVLTANGSGSGINSSAILTEVRSMWFGASGASVDGTQCATPAEVTINSGPKQYTVICTDNDSSTIYGSVKMPDSWDGGTVTFEQVYIQTAADTSALNGDIAAQCHGNGETVDSTYGTEIAIDDAAVTGSNKNDFTTSAAVTPAGTCAAGDMLYWRWQLDATGTTTAVATLHTLGFKMEYTSNVGD